MTAKNMLAIDADAFRITLLSWFDQSKRDMPWRQTKDPYAILLSEIMLQQTQVKTVIPYFEKFLAQYPTITDLANAEEATVLKLWQGLGYYRRARHLLAAARKVAKIHDGIFPQDKSAIDDLPGVGRYTSAAVASIAFNLACACVDGNVIRVISRLAAIDADVSQTATLRAIDSLAQWLLDPKSPGDHNQAMMELGATVCTPKNPCCLICPVGSYCQTKKQGDNPHSRPLKSRRVKVSKQTKDCGFFFLDNSFLLGQRSPDGLMGNLWEFPGQDLDTFQPWETMLNVPIFLKWQRPKPFRHKFTHLHVDYNVRVWELQGMPQWRQVPSDYSQIKMVGHSELATIPLTHVCKTLIPECLNYLER